MAVTWGVSAGVAGASGVAVSTVVGVVTCDLFL